MKRFTVFYAGLIYGEYENYKEFYDDRSDEIYNGCYIYVSPDGAFRSVVDNGWYRGDLTPYPEEDVPPELRTIVLLMS